MRRAARRLSAVLLAGVLASCGGLGGGGGTGGGNGGGGQRCAALSDCPCTGPKDCPSSWVCVLVAPQEAYCVQADGTSCERQSECRSSESCQGLDCTLGTGAAGCGFGVCLEKLSRTCSSNADCPSSSDLCVAPGAANFANAQCYR